MDRDIQIRVLDIACGNPGSIQVLAHLYMNSSHDQYIAFLDQLQLYNITGARPYYIWKEKCSKNYSIFLYHDLSKYTDDDFIGF